MVTSTNTRYQRPNTLKALRSTREQDICLLLCSSDADDAARLLALQTSLQALLGGRIVTPVHLTSHRFEVRHNTQFHAFVDHLRLCLLNIQPFPLVATGFVPLYSDFRDVNLLKWRIEVSAALRLLVERIEQALQAASVQSLYPMGWISTLVTALEDIPPLELETVLSKVTFPQYLFTVNQLVFSRVKTPQTFETLAQIELSKP